MWVSTCYIPVYIPRGTAFDRGMLDTNGHKPVDSLKMLDSPSLKSSDSSEKQQSENADFTAFLWGIRGKLLPINLMRLDEYQFLSNTGTRMSTNF